LSKKETKREEKKHRRERELCDEYDDVKESMLNL
jgi:hypothetical protein